MLLGNRSEGVQHKIIASLHQRRQVVLDGPRIAVMQGILRAVHPLAQRLTTQEGQQLGRADHEGPLQGLHEQHMPGPVCYAGRQPQQLEFHLGAVSPRLPARRVPKPEADARQLVDVSLGSPCAAV